MVLTFRCPGWNSAAVLAALVLAPLPAAAGNILVTTLADADAVDGDCSLREAILAANADAPYNECAAGTGTSDRILLTVPGTILLTSNLPAFSESAALIGLGAGTSTVDGQDARTLLRLDSGGSGQTFRVERLTLPNAAGDAVGTGAATGERIFDAPAVLNNPAGDACDVGAVEIGPLVALAEPEILRDGFESGTLLFWDLDVP